MSKNTKVSIIVPVFNSSLYFRQCLDSIISQTLKDIEIICVYDISKDNSLEILNEYAEKDKRIIIINLQENRRLGAARNAGINIAKGEYIGFVDSDDWIELDMYEKLLNTSLSIGGADIVTTTKIYRNRAENQYIERHIPLESLRKSKNEFNKFVCKNASAPLWMNIIKKKLFFDNELFFAEKLQHEDVPIAHALYCIAQKVVIVDLPLYHYRDNQKSISNTATENRFDLMITSIMYLNNMKRLGLYDLYKDECDYWFYTRYYCRMLSTCFTDFPVIRRDYIKKIKEEFLKYIPDISKNRYYQTKKWERFDIFLWIINKNTSIACFIYNIYKFLKISFLIGKNSIFESKWKKIKH
ncbi:glycosyltransferase [Leadbettera azotonutricia]|uniref:Glycosyltransferase n=1 Tax=Leadbettera azotonutricia (strain ATCC BAA-888 / DSM 13862 / ZAS-9) TaxID=545695 RepID=F5YAV6_LEAAZ|nr:glycosyltransferase [Leadbettera azotonutricia]AEF81241.1 glycosyltransferase [Leadbettera azotonutricia ZAS-9]